MIINFFWAFRIFTESPSFIFPLYQVDMDIMKKYPLPSLASNSTQDFTTTTTSTTENTISKTFIPFINDENSSSDETPIMSFSQFFDDENEFTSDPDNEESVESSPCVDIDIHKYSSQIKQNDDENRSNIRRLSGFDYEKSYAYNYLCTKFGGRPAFNELKSIATILQEHLNLRLDRAASRRKKVLIKWFDENIVVIKPFIELYMVVTKYDEEDDN
ncbi:hypothetical protein TRFO_36494 [Tritrichomonas foetus]|uniref:Uncharacterized protein n=1 Tax=Tritrichomonas foetus TaxID=1144522 RepID=A0A1J4JE05_9EUKA|nr:hypothetical protein TRFO_36494 [Tritrichomonas foetus]|eukprot:OHS97336.1 hypothetical protein TRFO_36494 [Tritrichomonas foetus]